SGGDRGEALDGAPRGADARRARLRRNRRLALVGRRGRRGHAQAYRGQARRLVQSDYRRRGHETVSCVLRVRSLSRNSGTDAVALTERRGALEALRGAGEDRATVTCFG